MIKTAAVLSLLVLGMAMLCGCNEGRRGVAVSGPYHDVELGYDVEKDAHGHTDIDLVHDVDHK
jgi:hypothetical protein